MTKDIIKDTIRRGVSYDTLTIEDVLILVNELLVEKLKTALEKAGGNILMISFLESFGMCLIRYNCKI